MKKANLSMGVAKILSIGILVLSLFQAGCATTNPDKKRQEQEAMQEKFKWWPTDAQPAPVKDVQRGGYWWWPNTPGEARPWGNRGYVYVYKIIFDYKSDELPPPKMDELRPSLLIKKIIKNVKIYFDYDHSDLRNDAERILGKAVDTLKRNPETDILITGNADTRGSENYNEKLGRRRAESVKEFMLSNGIPEERIRIVSRGKLDAVAPVTDLVGMQKDRNAQFMIAEVEEVMIPYQGDGAEVPIMANEATSTEDGNYMVEEKQEIEGDVKVATKEYKIQKGDTLEKIAKEQMGKAYRWKYLYELNKDRINNPNKLPVGKTIMIPIEVDAPAMDSTAPSFPDVSSDVSSPQSEMVTTETASETLDTREYTIQKGDTLGEISQKELGTAKRWREIMALNKDRIKDPNKLIAGKKILLPAK